MKLFHTLIGLSLSSLLFNACGDSDSLSSNGDSQLQTLDSKGVIGIHTSGAKIFRDAIAEFGPPNSYEPSIFKGKWPLQDSGKSLLTRFGTPTTIFDELPGEDPDRMITGYFHEALDIVRSNITVPDSVYAPVSGQAIVLIDGEEEEYDPYSVSIAILDEVSGLIVSLLHVAPDPDIFREDPVVVEKGQFIGKLAATSSMIPEVERSYRHVHLSLINPIKRELLDPLPFFESYGDQRGPSFRSTYFLDQNSNVSENLTIGKLDIVTEVFDRDNKDERNFEVKAIEARLLGPDSKLLWRLPKCELSDIFSKISVSHESSIAKVIDLTNTTTQTQSDIWIGDLRTDAANPSRTFRYVLTNLMVDQSGICQAIDDDSGYFDLSNVGSGEIQESSYSLELKLTDHSGNTSSFQKMLQIR